MSSERIIIDLREPLHIFERHLDERYDLPEYVVSEVVNMVLDVLIFELENEHETPDLARLGNFYRDRLLPDPLFHQRFLESFFVLVKTIAARLRGYGVYAGDGFEYAPEKNQNNRSIVVKKFGLPY